MQKVLLLSILVGSGLIPLWAARARDPLLGLKRAVFGMLGFELFYVIGVLWIFPRL